MELDHVVVVETTRNEVELDQAATTDEGSNVVGCTDDGGEFVESSGELFDDEVDFVAEEVES